MTRCLLIPTLTGITFSIVQYSLRGIADADLIVDLLPILILNVTIPLYIGYYRGGIKLKGHSGILERARGWVYLAAGILTYVSILASALTARELSPEFVRLTSHLEPFVRDLIVPIPGGVLTTIFAFTVWGGSSRLEPVEMQASLEFHSKINVQVQSVNTSDLCCYRILKYLEVDVSRLGLLRPCVKR